MRKLSRRELLLTGLNAGCLGAMAYVDWWEPGWLELTTKQVCLPKPLSTPLTLLHLSDLHYSETVSIEHLDTAIELGLRAKPDLICLTGDYITTTIPDSERYKRILNRLSEHAPTFASFGNHDGGGWAYINAGYESAAPVRRLLTESKITCLHNTRLPLRIRGNDLILVGLGDYWSAELDHKRTFRAIERYGDKPTIVLSHNPDSKEELRNYRWDLMLAGHTHGGEFVMPFSGKAPFCPVRDRRYIRGLLPWEDRQIHITRGVGNGNGMRFNSRPEVSLLKLI